MLGFLVATIAYGGVWLAVAMLFSVLFRAPATAALAALGVWLLFALFWSVGDAARRDTDRRSARRHLRPATSPICSTAAGIGPALAEHALRRDGPGLAAARRPGRSARCSITSAQGALLGAPLPVSQSFILIWPQLTGLIAATIVIFAIAYVVFQRQEIRA